jgi:hypothetical protein
MVLLSAFKALLAFGRVPLPKKASSIIFATPVLVPPSRASLKEGAISSKFICVAAEPSNEDGSLFAPKLAILLL